MKRLFAAALPVGLALWALAQPAGRQPALAAYFPPGALIHLEARDLAALVADWNASAEKSRWLESDNYQVFSRSRLFMRLDRVQQEFAAAAGVAADLPLVQALAGRESALAVYDIGEMHFLYLSRLESARAIESALWRAGAKFESRSSAGRPYFVRLDAVRRREAAFAAADGWVLVATREDLLAQALALVAGNRAPSLRDEAWHRSALGGAPPAGELRMTLNLPLLVRTPHVRSYWIQRNAAELGQYAAGLVDLYRGPREYREERRLVRPQPARAATGAGLGRLLSLAPPGAGLVRAWSAPSVDSALSLLASKMLAPAMVASARQARLQPVVSDEDFDTLLEEAPPPPVVPELRAEGLRALLEAAKVEGVMLVESSRRDRDGLFVSSDATVALLAAGDWNVEAVKSALGGAVEGLYTVSGLGLTWRAREGSFETDGLARLAVAARGRVLLVATSAEALAPVLARAAEPAAKDGPVYYAEYRHPREIPNFERMMRMIDRVARPEEEPSPEEPGEPGEPMFFSGNIASLGRTLGRLDSVSLSVRDSGVALSQTVVYRLSQ